MRLAILLLMVVSIFVAAYLLVSYERSRQRDAAVKRNASESKSAAYEKTLLEIAAKYQSYSLVRPEIEMAALDCAPDVQGSRVALSQSDDTETHGRKLYYLFAANQQAYRQASEQKSPVGQVLVKESWEAVETDDEDFWRTSKHAGGAEVFSKVSYDGRTFAPGKKRELFVMLKLPAETPNTDRGWIYGVVSADGSKVVESGKLQNCMGCHKEAGADRLFGVGY